MSGDTEIHYGDGGFMGGFLHAGAAVNKVREIVLNTHPDKVKTAGETYTAIANRIVAESLRYAALLTEKGRLEILRRFEQSSTWPRGKAVEVDGRIRGVTAGLDENGFLLVQTPDKLETVIAGGVRSL